MTATMEYINQVKEQVLKAINHLDYSYKIIISLPTNPEKLNEETLAAWESFSARFSRVVDLFLMRYLKAVIKNTDSAFDGTLRDFLHQGEKLKLIDNTETWMFIRGLRNIIAHEYTDKDLEIYLNQLKNECPRLLELKSMINNATYSK